VHVIYLLSADFYLFWKNKNATVFVNAFIALTLLAEHHKGISLTINLTSPVWKAFVEDVQRLACHIVSTQPNAAVANQQLLYAVQVVVEQTKTTA